MNRNFRQNSGIGLLLLCALCSLALPAENSKRLWVLQAPDTIVEYDPNTFSQINSHKVPPQVSKSPGNLAVNTKGQMIFVPPMDEDLSAVAAGSAQGKLWFWGGQRSTLIDRKVRFTRSPDEHGQAVVEAVPQCFLSADGQRLYWFENEFRKLVKEVGLEISASTTVHFWQTDLEGGQPQPLMESSFPPCSCGTSVCSETCPEADAWVPEDGIDDFFVITHWIPGQIGSDYQSSFIALKTENRWSPRKLAQPIEQVLDARQRGAVILEAIPDAGCCGWDNDSNDQTLLNRNGMQLVLFDERRRYDNSNYDVSFFTSNAEISPDLRSVAITIVSSHQPREEIRLSSEGKPDLEELERIRKAFSDLPAVEVMKLTNPPTRSAFIPHAIFTGWLNNNEILIVEENLLVVLDPAAGTQRKSQIKVAGSPYVILR